MHRLLACVLIVACAAPAVAQDTWYTLKSDTGAFEVQLPSKPRPLTRKVKTQTGDELTVNLWLTVDNANKRIFIASYGEHVKASDPAKFLPRSMQGNMAAHNGKETSKKTIKLDGKYPGLEYAFEGKVNDMTRYGNTQVFLVDGKKVYQLIVISAGEKATAEVVQKFFKSFKLK